jgi:adenylate kinase
MLNINTVGTLKTMTKTVILITGTPCTGKTTVAKQLASQLEAQYVNLTELATTKNLIQGTDKKRNTAIIDEKRMKQTIAAIIKHSDKNDIIIDGHYAVNVVPEWLITHVFVLRRNPVELKKLMEQRGFSGQKLWENLAAEILDVCLVEALNVIKKGKICEVDASNKSAKEVIGEILDVLDERRECCVGIVDWLGTLEKEGLLEEYLKI